MKSVDSPIVNVPTKASTGISGFDEITGGGMPRGRTTVLTGGPGSGKTVFTLQFLMHGAGNSKEPGIFVAFEETSKRILINAEKAKLEVHLKAMQTKLLAKQLEHILLIQNTMSRERDVAQPQPDYGIARRRYGEAEAEAEAQMSPP